MQSPFPGMDPYLEDPGLWPDVHHRLLSITQELLAQQLRPMYYVRIAERVYVSDEDDPGRVLLVPERRVDGWPGGGDPGFVAEGRAAPDVAEMLIVTSRADDEVREARLQIIDRERRQPVTVIEVLRPVNKLAGSCGQASYRRGRKEVLASPSHLVEIDLLRQGMPLYPREIMPPHDYLIHVSPASMRPRSQVWPVCLNQRLPIIPVPLREGDADARLDLQEVLALAYDRAAYDLSIDYKTAPVPPLEPAAAAWADALLQHKELR